DLAEIGIVGRVERQVAAQAQAEVHPGAGVEVLAIESRGGAEPVGLRRDERRYFGGNAALEVVEAGDCAGLEQEAGVGPPGVGPGAIVAGALAPALDVEAPAPGPVPGVAQAVEGNPDLDHVARIGDLPAGVPEIVGVLVAGAAGERARGEAAF